MTVAQPESAARGLSVNPAPWPLSFPGSDRRRRAGFGRRDSAELSLNVSFPKSLLGPRSARGETARAEAAPPSEPALGALSAFCLGVGGAFSAKDTWVFIPSPRAIPRYHPTREPALFGQTVH